MGVVYAQLELINRNDPAMVRRYIIEEEEVRRMSVTMMADTGSEYMCINKTVQKQPGLAVREHRQFQLANGQVDEYEIAGPIEIRFRNRRFLTKAVVLPGSNETLVGAIPTKGMDVLVHPARHKMIVNPEHSYVAQMKLK